MLSAFWTFVTNADTAIGDRFFPDRLPQAVTLPAATFQVISALRTPTMQHNDNLPMKRIQVDTWGTTPEAALAAADAIRQLFHYYQAGDISGIQGVFADGERSLGYDAERKVHGYSRDFLIWHAEA